MLANFKKQLIHESSIAFFSVNEFRSFSNSTLNKKNQYNHNQRHGCEISFGNSSNERNK
jgi:hypothetical protein